MPQIISGVTNREKDSNATSLYERLDFPLIEDFYFGPPITLIPHSPPGSLFEV